MSDEKLSAFEKRLCNVLQNGLPINRRPYAEIANVLKSDEATVLKRTRGLVKKGVIRRIGAVVNWRVIGKVSTLVAASVPKEKLKQVISAIKAMEGVSHNYLREHRLNLWFTLRADSRRQIDTTLKKLSKRFDIAFYSLPVVRVFKLEVRFNAESGGRKLLKPAVIKGQHRRGKLDETDKKILAKLHGNLKVVSNPYKFLCAYGLEIDEVLARIIRMVGRGAITRLGAIVNHHKLGFNANAMFVCRTEKGGEIKIAEDLADLQNVSHCYQRKLFRGWPFNIYAMMHSSHLDDIRREAEKFAKMEKVEKWEILPTVRRN